MKVEIREGHFPLPSGERLYYKIYGNSGYPIVLCNGIAVSTLSFWGEIARNLAQHYTVINWDYRGHGYSDPPLEPEKMSIELCAEDLHLLLKHLKIEKAVVAGHSMGVQVIFEYYSRYPETVSALIPILGTYKHPFDYFFRYPRSAQVFQKLFSLAIQYPSAIKKLWEQAFEPQLSYPLSKLFNTFLSPLGGYMVHPKLCSREEIETYISHVQQLSPETFFYLAASMQRHSAEEILPQIEVPTLIFAAKKDLFTPYELSVKMKKLIPDSELFIVPEGSHAAIAEQPELFWLRIRQFVEGRVLTDGAQKSDGETPSAQLSAGQNLSSEKLSKELRQKEALPSQ